jgi:hypothetical protein
VAVQRPVQKFDDQRDDRAVINHIDPKNKDDEKMLNKSIAALLIV